MQALESTSPWNVRAAALTLIAKRISHTEDFDLVRDLVRRELVEGKKVAVLVAALGASRLGRKELAKEIDFLTGHAEAAVVKAAMDVKHQQ